jgi:hypothetical protein
MLQNANGISRAHGATVAFVTKWIIRKSDLSVVRGEDLIQNIATWNKTTGTYNAPAPGSLFALTRGTSILGKKRQLHVRRTIVGRVENANVGLRVRAVEARQRTCRGEKHIFGTRCRRSEHEGAWQKDRERALPSFIWTGWRRKVKILERRLRREDEMEL